MYRGSIDVACVIADVAADEKSNVEISASHRLINDEDSRGADSDEHSGGELSRGADSIPGSLPTMTMSFTDAKVDEHSRGAGKPLADAKADIVADDNTTVDLHGPTQRQIFLEQLRLLLWKNWLLKV